MNALPMMMNRTAWSLLLAVAGFAVLTAAPPDGEPLSPPAAAAASQDAAG